MPNKYKFFPTLWIYLLWAIYVVYSIYNQSFQTIQTYIAPSFLLLLIHDFLYFWNFPMYMSGKKILPEKIYNDKNKNTLSQMQWFILYNRYYIFPTLLIIYLIWILGKQLWFYIWTALLNIVLIFTIFSGFFTLFQEKLDDEYLQSSRVTVNNYLFLCIFLSIFGSYIVSLETQRILYLSPIIWLLSGIIIFLVWMSLIDDEDQQNNFFS